MIVTLAIAIVAILLFPYVARLAFGILGLALVFGIVAMIRAEAQQQTRTTCYDSGNTRICETFDQYGAVQSKSRCYQSGKDTRCETQSFSSSSSSSGITIVPRSPK